MAARCRRHVVTTVHLNGIEPESPAPASALLSPNGFNDTENLYHECARPLIQRFDTGLRD